MLTRPSFKKSLIVEQFLSQLVIFLKVQLTPKIFFRLYKSPCFSDHRCEKIIVVAILVNFL